LAEKESPAERHRPSSGAETNQVISGLVAAAAPGATSPAAVAAATPTPVFTGLGLVDGQLPAVHLLAAQGRAGGLGLLAGPHPHEPEPLRAAGVAVLDDRGRLHPPERLEQLLQGTVSHAVGQVPDVQLPAHATDSSTGRARRGSRRAAVPR